MIRSSHRIDPADRLLIINEHAVNEHPARLIELVGASDSSICDVLEARATRTPDAVFVQSADGTWSYAEAWTEVKRVASWLNDHGFAGRGHRVASYVRNSPAALWTWLGVATAGALYVPLNREQRGALLLDVVRRSAADLLVTDTEGLQHLPDAEDVGLSHAHLVDGRIPDDRKGYTWIDGPQGEATLPPLPGPFADVEIMFTSGSTGRSKAVLLPHNMFCRGAARFAEAAGMGPADVFHAWLPLYHIFGQLHMTMATLISGGTLALRPSFSRSQFWSQVRHDGCTIFGGMANIIHFLSSEPPRPTDADNPLRLGIIAKPPATLRAEFERRFGVRFVDSYGMTEVEPVTLPPRHLVPGSCGRLSPDFEAIVLDERGQASVGPEVRGELAIRPRVRGVMFRGYDGDAQHTVSAWQDLWFHTGDVVRRDQDGNYFLVERTGRSLRRSGENVSASELEELICRHPVVAACAAIGIPSEYGEQEIKIVVAPRHDRTIDPTELHAFCRRELAKFMVPRYVEIVDELPYLSAGKIDRKQLDGLRPGVWDFVEQRRPQY